MLHVQRSWSSLACFCSVDFQMMWLRGCGTGLYSSAQSKDTPDYSYRWSNVCWLYPGTRSPAILYAVRTHAGVYAGHMLTAVDCRMDEAGDEIEHYGAYVMLTISFFSVLVNLCLELLSQQPEDKLWAYSGSAVDGLFGCYREACCMYCSAFWTPT